MAAKLGVNKMKVYRAIKKLNITEQYKCNNTMYFNEVDMNAIIKEVSNRTLIQNSVTRNGKNENSELIEMLEERLIKQDQIIEQQREQLKAEQKEYRQALRELQLVNRQLINVVLTDNQEMHYQLQLQSKTDNRNTEASANILDMNNDGDHNSVINDDELNYMDNKYHGQQKNSKKRWLFGGGNKEL